MLDNAPQNTIKVMLVRHGQTAWNVEKRIQGSNNIPLDHMGRYQAQNLRDKIQKIDVIYSSPLTRALETASIIAEKFKLTPIIKPFLSEMGFGDWEGHLRSDLQRAFPELYGVFCSHPEKFDIDNAEPFTVVQRRMVQGVESILKKNAGVTILIVSHWYALQAFLQAIRINNSFATVIRNAESKTLFYEPKSKEWFEDQGRF